MTVKPQDMNVSNALTIFERAASASITNDPDRWLWLTADFLGLTPIHLLAVQKVLEQGRWRKARNPKGYVKVCAKRELIKMGLNTDLKDETLYIPRLIDEDGRALTHDSYIDYLSFEGPVKEGGVWRSHVIRCGLRIRSTFFTRSRRNRRRALQRRNRR